MKSTITFLFTLISSLSFSQTNFYEKDGKKITIIGEKTTLIFSKDSHIEKIVKQNGEKIANTLIAALLPSVIDLGFKISTDLIEKNLKKYTNEFSARNTYTNSHKYVSGFTLNREIKPQGKDNNIPAFVIELLPEDIGGQTFVFYVNKLKVDYSGSKTKNNYNYNDYLVEVKVGYFDGNEKKEQVSAPISIPLIKVDSDNKFDKNEFITDKFPINPKFEISEVSVKIVETNSAKVKAEKLKSLSDKYSEDAKNAVKTTVNFYIEKSKEEAESKEAKVKTEQTKGSK